MALTVAIEADRVCTNFDRALRNGEQPRVEDFLAKFESSARQELLRDLLALEFEHRLAMGDAPSLHEYESRFPQDCCIVRSEYANAVMPAQIGRFRVERLLGKGGFGRVYLAYDDHLKRHVAIKALLGLKQQTHCAGRTLLDEARLAAGLRHPAIVTVYEVGQDDNENHFLVLDYVEGTTLKRALADASLSLPQMLEMLIVVADGLQYAHERGLTHRDLKPANILIDRQNRPYLTDFGLAVHESAQRLREGEIAGTPPYMAPEQVAGETHRIDGRTDIWALGVILYEVITGCAPFSGENRDELFYAIRHLDPRPPRQRNSSIPSRLERITLTCLAKRMSDRYGSAAELAAVLRRARQELLHGAREGPFLDVDAGSSTVPPVVSRVVPKGLRSFEFQDAEFFLQLLPGPRTSDGVPESVRFWQQRIEESNEDATFPVGLIYGPSGCGKSSFVKAGLLPRLHDHVTPVLVECTRDETELRLLKALRKLIPDLPQAAALPDIIGGIREQRWGEPGRKFVIVLDQFEQWLHANPVHENNQLTDALRQCDGGHIQSILLVRDDFWMQLTRLMRAIEVPLIEGANSAAVDLFDPRHAVRVLGEFGIAYGKLPSSVADWSDGQQQFVAEAVEGLAIDGRVVPVRLALFVEMFKGRPWTLRTLKQVGGAEGTGEAFLEDAFASSTAAPEHRLHQAAARAVLERLLPPEGTEIKGNMRSERELLDASGYARSPREFDRLLGILDTELRLLTPTDPAGQAADPAGIAGQPSVGRHYQLTHDYLVPSIRSWLTREKRSTARGRAELCLSERSAAYRAQAHVRQLPTAWEWLSIELLTNRYKRADSERRLLRAAARHHSRRLGMAFALAMVLLWLLYEGTGRLRATGYVRSLASAETSDVPSIIHDLAPIERWAAPQLKAMFAHGGDKERLHAAMALLPTGSGTTSYLIDRLLLADAHGIEPIRRVLFEYGNRDDVCPALWSVVEQPKHTPASRLRAAAGLALDRFDGSGRWNPFADDLFDTLIDDLTANPGNFDRWVQLLMPIRTVLEAPAITAFENDAADTQSRNFAAALMASFNHDRVERLVELAVEADADQFRPLQSALLRRPEAASRLLTDLVEQSPPQDLSEEEKDLATRRQANAAVCLFELGHPQALASGLTPSSSRDRRLQTWTIDRFGAAASSESAFRSHLDAALSALTDGATPDHKSPTDAEARYAWTLIVGNLGSRLAHKDFRARVVPILEAIYQADLDAGVHSAAEWALRQWDAKDAINRLRATFSGSREFRDGGWYVTPSFHTMVMVSAPGKIKIGSPKSEPGREKDESERELVLSNSFCVSTAEVTQHEVCRLLHELQNRFPNDFSLDSESPANDVTLLDALKYCRRLSEAEEIAEDEMCYPAVEQIDDNFIPDYRRATRNGYRLLTNAEWQYVCRSGSATPRFYGFAPSLLNQYAWFVENSGGKSHPVGALKPNRFGLFDVYGNLREWTIYPTALLSKSAITLGGSYSVSARMLRSANWRADPITFRGLQNGFRIARTWKGTNFSE
jgi:serine/threonine protein kinase/formylglycine-generating enzyme required for sulfatase activity